MTTEPTGLFQGLAPLLVNRTVIMTVAADGKGLLTLNVIPKKVKDDESDAMTTALCITASAAELDRDLPAQLREYTEVHAKAQSNIQKVKDDLAAAEKAERESAEEKRAKKAKGRVVPPAVPTPKPQASLGLFDQNDAEPEVAVTPSCDEQEIGEAIEETNDYPDWPLNPTKQQQQQRKDTMTITPMKRIFEFQGIRLPDPNSAMTVEQVRGVFATQYPEIATASLSGPETVGDKCVYRFERAIGTKG